MLARKISANIGDYASLRLILGIDPPEFARFYPDMEIATPSTFDTIDSFLDKFGQKSVEVTADAYELAYEEEPESDFGSLMKEHRYKDALMLIEAQNLNNPQKSIYFAHQIRFLKKLIAIQNYRNKTQG